MANIVLSASEARKELNGILERFRQEGSASQPVAFGSHRKPEAVILPYEHFQQMSIDVISPEHVEIDDEGPHPCYTTPVSMGGHVDAVEAMRQLLEATGARLVESMFPKE